MKERQSNMEMLRILAMLGVVLLHANYVSLGYVGVSDVVNNPYGIFGKMLAEQICIVCVDVFVLISGWFGIQPTVKGIFNILYQVFFYGVLLMLIGIACGIPVPRTEMLYLFLLGGYYWFIPAYLGLYVISPVLNAFVENSHPRTMMCVLAGSFILEFIFGWATELGTYNAGSSLISFVFLYLLARFVNQYSNFHRNLTCRVAIALYFVCTLLPVVIAFVGMRCCGSAFCPIKYSSPFVISASVLLVLGFSKLKIQNKVINWVACSTFSIYIVHQHPMIMPLFKSQMYNAYNYFGGLIYVPVAIAITLLMGIICVLVDKVRMYTWGILCRGFLDNIVAKFRCYIDCKMTER